MSLHCYDNSVLFIEILRQLVFVLCIVMCDVIRSSPGMFVRKRKSTERAVHAIVCDERDLEIRRERWNCVARSLFRKWTLRNPDQNPWEFACDHRSP